MKEQINKITEKLNSGCLEKAFYIDILKECDNVVFSFLQKENYENVSRIDLFRLSTDERLDIAKRKMEMCKSNPNVALQEVIKNKMQCLENFIEKYRIGFIQKVQLSETGFMKVDIPCLISSRGYTTYPHSAKKLFEIQLQFLKNQGFDIAKNNMGYYFKNNENNINRFTQLLSERNCKHIEFRTLDNRIHSISFLLNIEDVEKMDEIVFETNFKKTNIINEDEKILLTKYINEINFLKDFSNCVEEQSKLNCYSLIENYFSEICKIFEYSGKVSQKHENRFSDEISKNSEIREIEEKLSSFYKNINIKENICKIKENIDKYVSENIGFYVSDCYFDKYGLVNISLKYITNPHFIMKTNCILETALKSTFETTDGDREKENLFIIDNYKNKEIIDDALRNFCHDIDVTDVIVSKRNKTYVITGITIFIDNISDLIS